MREGEAMSDDRGVVVPVWTLATGNVRVPALSDGVAITPERLAELRGVLAGLADHPVAVATLEAHPLPKDLDRSRGMLRDAASPLARHLSELVAQSVRSSRVVANATASGEVLYRMVIPAKVAAQVGQGIVRPMASKATSGGIYSALRGSTGVVANATFVPVGKAATAGAIGGAGATAGVAAGATALTVAAPLVLMALAVGVSAHADHRRQQATDRITDLLEQLHDDKLDEERNDLDGCHEAIDKATAILLDQGKIGASLGLDSAVHEIRKAIAATRRRLAKWRRALGSLPEGLPVEVGELARLFPGVDTREGVFHAHLELAALAIALKRRVIVLQAVEHAQTNAGNPFENFVDELKVDQHRLDELESGIASVLTRLSTLELASPRGRRLPFSAGEVERLMRAANSIHQLGDRGATETRATDVAIEIARNKNGSLVVFPALPV